MLEVIITLAAVLLIVGVIALALMHGGLRARDGTIHGRRQTQEEFDAWMARLEARNARRKRWLERH